MLSVSSVGLSIFVPQNHCTNECSTLEEEICLFFKGYAFSFLFWRYALISLFLMLFELWFTFMIYIRGFLSLRNLLEEDGTVR